MVLCTLSVQHGHHGLTEVERVSTSITGLADHLSQQRGISGVCVLSTCNRVEVMVDAQVAPHTVTQWLRERVDANWDEYVGEEALLHTFRVAAGLESMVVGEREIAGQLRRAHKRAIECGHSSAALTLMLDDALKTSREVANQTSLGAAGRSVVSEGLDLLQVPVWSMRSVLLVGTGMYAGAVVAELRRRGCTDIVVHSDSGRSQAFAASHAVGQVTDLASGVAGADVIITCRGRGVIVGVADLAAPVKVLDLSLVADVDPRVGEIPGITYVGLHTIDDVLRERGTGDTQDAQEIVRRGVDRAIAKLRSRAVSPGVARLRDAVMDVVADEIERLPEGVVTHDEAVYALRRLAARMLHTPSARARVAAQQGRAHAYLAALQEVYGIDAAPPEIVGAGSCPVTEVSLDDLGTPQ